MSEADADHDSKTCALMSMSRAAPQEEASLALANGGSDESGLAAELLENMSKEKWVASRVPPDSTKGAKVHHKKQRGGGKCCSSLQHERQAKWQAKVISMLQKAQQRKRCQQQRCC